MKTKNTIKLIVGILLAVIILAIVIPVDDPSKQPKEVEKPEPQERIPLQPVTDLTKAYENNEVSADNQYKGKKVALAGRIESIGKDVLDEPYVVISGHKWGYNVQCYFKNTDGLASLRKGELIWVFGRCEGLTLLTVMVHDCKILEQTN